LPIKTRTSTLHEQREDSRDCGGVSTRGHGKRAGPDGDKFLMSAAKSGTQETLGGSGVSEANGVLRNHDYLPLKQKGKSPTDQSRIDFLVNPQAQERISSK
jgi:hypothetical protein